jgi:protein-S-isoprenylcysteine O-methyltransferase Ste14
VALGETVDLPSPARSDSPNALGQLTPDQQQLALHRIRAETSSGLWSGVALAVLFGFFFFAALGSPDMDAGTAWPGLVFFGGLALIFAVVAAAAYWRRRRDSQEVEAGIVERADGHIVWEGGAYRAEVPGHTLNLTAFNLAAGTYTFSFMPRTGRVVAADLVALDTPAEAQDELRHALAVSNHFNLDDLPALRQGRLGTGGGRRLRRAWTGPVIFLLASLLLFGLFIVLVAVEPSLDALPVLFIVAAVAGLAGAFGALATINLTRDVLAGQVSSATGTVYGTIHQTHGRGAHTYYYYKLDKHTWLVTAEAYRALATGHDLRVYFLPRSHTLVGMEPVG